MLTSIMTKAAFNALTLLLLFVAVQDAEAFMTLQSNVPIKAKLSPKLNKAILPLLGAASKTQSITNRIHVERLINELTETALQNKATMCKPIQPGSYRTVWSTVTADNFFGFLLNNKPSNVLGGPSWQIVSDDMKKGTNIVYWKDFDIRMAGLSRLSPLKKGGGGYGLTISGLEFRWGAGGCPEKEGSSSNVGKSWKLFELPEDATLQNGVGTLELLYNDGVVRITRDDVQDNTYIHIKEPLGGEFEKMFSPQMV